MVQFEISAGMFFDTTPSGGAKSEFQMMDNTSPLPECLTEFTQPAAFDKYGTQLDGGAFQVLQGEKITLITSISHREGNKSQRSNKITYT